MNNDFFALIFGLILFVLVVTLSILLHWWIKKPSMRWNEEKYPTYNKNGEIDWDDNRKNEYRWLKGKERDDWINEHYKGAWSNESKV